MPLTAAPRPPGAVMIVYIIWVVCTDEEASGRQAVVGALFYIAWYIAGEVAVRIPRLTVLLLDD